MTPNNIVNMAKLKGLDIIAVSDHNSVGNVRSVMAVSQGLQVIPAMELTTEEEIHMLLLFPSIETAEKMQEIVYSRMMKVVNREEIFGEQILMDSEDKIIEKKSNLLIVSSSLSLENVLQYSIEFDFLALPAHVDKASNGIIAILGELNDDWGFTTVEVSKRCSITMKEEFSARGYNVITDSDAHYLEDISEREEYIELDELGVLQLLEKLRNKNIHI